MKFNALINTISQTHLILQEKAIKAVNRLLTLRNWLVGYYIVEFEQSGEDRAAYGEGLLESIAAAIKIKGLSAPELSRCRQFYQVYPHLRKEVLSVDFVTSFKIFGTASQELTSDLKNILGTVSQEMENSPEKSFLVPPKKLLETLSYSHFVELIKIEEALKRSFYEIEAIKGAWSVRELKRQIHTLYFERTGLSQNPKENSTYTQLLTQPRVPSDAIKSVYTLEFLGIPSGVLSEEQLETALLNALQAFILELGHGFCFEHRQKRILIDGEYYFADLVFYHRILKCHVIVELKVDAFKHEHLAQLNTYVAYYNDQVKLTDDNPAVGILLCTQKGQKLVEYATAGMDNQLFISTYMLQLPDKKKLEEFVLKEIKRTVA